MISLPVPSGLTIPTRGAATSERGIEEHEREHTNVVIWDERELARHHAGWLKNSKSLRCHRSEPQ
jgi:hypothetical protein